MLARLTAIVLALALHHGHRDETRLRQVAADIWAAAESSPVFCGQAAVESTALGLVAIAHHESGWHPRVQDCRYNPHDPAVSLFALQGPIARGGRSREAVCSDNALAARLAGFVLTRFRRAGSLYVMARGYASGDTRIVSRAAREIADLIAALHWRERIVVAYRDRCLTANYLE
jgi:hypothetical protein